jgi:hypothetical protein
MIILFTGCSIKELDKEFKEHVDQNYMKETTLNRNYTKEKIREIHKRKVFIDLSVQRKLSQVLEELGSIDGKVYMLQGEDIDVRRVSNGDRLRINSFNTLNNYIKDTTNFTMVVTKNRFLKNRTKVVELRDLKSVESNLGKIPFTIQGSIAVVDALEEISKVTGFNIIFSDNSSAKKQPAAATESLDDSLEEAFSDNYISYRGNNVANFLNLLSNNYNIFVDIDYAHKIIKFSKTKDRVFHIFVNNIDITGTMDNEKKYEGTEASQLSVKTNVEIKLLDDLEKNLRAIITNDDVMNFNKSSGQVYIRATKSVMESAAKLIHDFNAIFDKQLDFTLDIYEFVVKKDFRGGVSVGAAINSNFDGAAVSTTGNTNELTDNLIQSIFSYSNGNTMTVNANIQNMFARLTKVNKHGYMLKNNIPYAMDLTDSKSYIQSIKSTTTTSNGVTTTIREPDTDNYDEGIVVTVLPRVVGKKIELNIAPTLLSVNSITETTFDGETITLPDVSNQRFKSNITLQSGEKKIIGYITQYKNAKDYAGIVPIEDFLFGGENDQQFIRKEIVFVSGVKIK